MTSRRQVLQGLIFSLGGAAALSAFRSEANAAECPEAADCVFYTEEERALVVFLADAIIPRTDTPGALDVSVHAGMDHLYRTWASASTQAVHKADLARVAQQLDGLAKTPDKRFEALAALDAAAFDWNGDTSGYWGYRNIKSLIATVYYLSEPGATQELQYELVPGRWIASAPIAEIGRTWAQ